jgi:iron-sulfur cluster repair protein YtfE (RIC family)
MTMLTIGSRRPAAPQDVVDLLLECHTRIRSFCDLAVRLGEAPSPAPEEVTDAATRVRRYLVEALPLHARDEEESILPRLAGRAPEIDRALVVMHAEHGAHGPLVDAVVALCGELADTPERHPALAPELARAARALREDFEEHLAAEERTIFPAIRSLVAPEERTRMLEELRARRAPASSTAGAQSSR